MRSDRARIVWPALVSLALGCAGTSQSTHAEEPEPESRAAACTRLTQRTEQAQAALDTCRAETPPPPPWSHAAAFDDVDAQVSEQLRLMREEESVLGALEAQRLGERIWELLDEVRPELESEPQLADRVEDAIETLLREHDREARERNLVALASVVGALRAALEPPPPVDACTDAQRAHAAAWGESEAACRDLHAPAH